MLEGVFIDLFEARYLTGGGSSPLRTALRSKFPDIREINREFGRLGRTKGGTGFARPAFARLCAKFRKKNNRELFHAEQGL
jgi:hypothetical protein